jgi:solute carrier family 25 carnitine/acylcarnitine transporter 20/29
MSNDDRNSSFIPYAITFSAGASYGLTTVLVGQPLDTIKTRMQGIASSSKPSSSLRTESAIGVLRNVYSTEGIRGLYRGGLPLVLGGSFMRSAQFGVSAEASNFLKRNNFPSYKILGTVDSNILLAGIAGGLGRAFVEIPTDFFKIRRQVQNLGLNNKSLSSNSNNNTKQMTIENIRKEILTGSAITMARNTILFATFIVYIDLSKQACEAGLIPSYFCTTDGTSLTPFMKGAICSNMAWMTCWPMDVVKTQRQSGNYDKSKGGIHFERKYVEWKIISWIDTRFDEINHC